jgi:hypothetical protein
MSIRDRIEDAKFLWQNGRHEGAFLSALLAVAATARLRYPDRKAVKDGEAFTQFFKNARPGNLGVEFRGELHPIEHIFYKWLRCELVHEGGLPVDIKFMDNTAPNSLSFRAGGAPNFVLLLSYSWFEHLVAIVASAPENASIFSGCKL